MRQRHNPASIGPPGIGIDLTSPGSSIGPARWLITLPAQGRRSGRGCPMSGSAHPVDQTPRFEEFGGSDRAGHVLAAAQGRLDLAVTLRASRHPDRGPIVLGDRVVHQRGVTRSAGHFDSHAAGRTGVGGHGCSLPNRDQWRRTVLTSSVAKPRPREDRLRSDERSGVTCRSHEKLEVIPNRQVRDVAGRSDRTETAAPSITKDAPVSCDLATVGWRLIGAGLQALGGHRAERVTGSHSGTR